MEYIQEKNIFKSCLLTVPIVMCLCLSVQILRILTTRKLHISLSLPFPLVFCALFHVISLFSTSYIEEEHQTWYYLGPSFIIVLIFRNVTHGVYRTDAAVDSFGRVVWNLCCNFPILAIIALVRKLNQTGDKWKHLSDFSDFLSGEQNKFRMSLFLLLSKLT